MARNRYLNLGLMRVLGAGALATGVCVLNYYSFDENKGLDSNYLLMDVMVGVNCLILGLQGLRDIFFNGYRVVEDLPEHGLRQVYISDNIATE